MSQEVDFKPGYLTQYRNLFNTIPASRIKSSVMKQLQQGSKKIFEYKLSPSDLPKNYDTRDIFKYKGQSLISNSLDQGGCGSCWAFASTTAFTDRYRINIAKNHPDQMADDPLFQEIDPSTGDIGLENMQNGVVNKRGRIYHVDTLNRFSPYYTAGFTSKLLSTCTASDVTQCVDNTCDISCCQVDISKLSQDFNNCIGCGGNAIIMPLMMFKQRGVALLSDFGLHGWACTFGLKDACGSIDLTKKFPLYRVKDFLHVDQSSNFPEGIDNMEDWMKLELYTNGPITVSYDVRKTFFEFFNNPANVTHVYSQANDTGPVVGGHAVMIVGYGVVEDENAFDYGRKYWLVRNSWGPSWGDNGFFKIERGANLANIEADWGCVYLEEVKESFIGREYFSEEINSNKLKAALLFASVSLAIVGLLYLVSKK